VSLANLEREILLASATLGILELDRAHRLRRKRGRLAFSRDLVLAVEAMESSRRALDIAADSALRLARLLDRERGEDARLAHRIRLELGDDEERQAQ
jgi:hypothetical protein